MGIDFADLDRLLDPIEALPDEVLVACHEGVEHARTFPEEQRRRHYSLVVCECNDARAHELVLALSRARGEPIGTQPDKAVLILHRHRDLAGLARGSGYELPEVPDPPMGCMRIFVFTLGTVLASTIRIEDEAVVRRKEGKKREDGEAFSRRIFEQKQQLIAKAVAVLLASETRRMAQIVVVFGSPSETARAVYRELAVLPENAGFLAELPERVLVACVSYETFMEMMRRRDPDIAGVDASALGVDQVRLAIFTPGGVHIQRIESSPFTRGGAA